MGGNWIMFRSLFGMDESDTDWVKCYMKGACELYKFMTSMCKGSAQRPACFCIPVGRWQIGMEEDGNI